MYAVISTIESDRKVHAPFLTPNLAFAFGERFYPGAFEVVPYFLPRGYGHVQQTRGRRLMKN